MKTLLLFGLCLVGVFAIDKYPTKYDNIDVDNVLKNKRLFNNYMQCLLKKGKCTEDGTLLRDLIPDALLTECAKCSEVQKTKAEKVIKHIKKEHPQDWEDLLKVYDPEKKYVKSYQKYLDE
uniref:Chemosensory protein 5 n=1 Tax=Dastarcus helophoroides TaxID=1169899 RepID=A0A1I9HZR7_9CUCU|nr:chemosensory protein 5 [Dastarcus helophoroides]